MSALWNWDPLTGLLLGLAAWRYMDGVWTLRRQAGTQRSVTRAHVAAFWAGMATLFVAFVSPVDALGEQRLAWHMVQHLLLTSVAAPLLVYAVPPVALAWALPRRWRRPLAQWAHRRSRLRQLWRWVYNPPAVWLLYAVTLWLWHLPGPYDAALRSGAVHLAEHASFFGTALLFWSLLPRRHGGALGYGGAVAYLGTTAVHSSVLGLLMSFSSSVWYDSYRRLAASGAWSALQDQQAAGALMWGPGGLVYLVAVLWMLARAFQHMDHAQPATTPTDKQAQANS